MSLVINHALLDRERGNIALNSISLSYAVSVFDCFRIYLDVEEKLFAFRLMDHYQRFTKGLKFLIGTQNYTADHLMADLRLLLDGNKITSDAYVKLIAYWPEPSPSMSVFDLQKIPPTYALSVSTSHAIFPSRALTMKTSPSSRNPAGLPAHLKSGANYFHFRAELNDAIKEGYDNLLFSTEDGSISEAVDSCIFFIIDDEIVTPPLSAGVLPSVTRDTVLRIAMDAGIRVAERPVQHKDCIRASGAFLANTASLLRNVRRIDNGPDYVFPHPLFTTIEQLFRNEIAAGALKYRDSSPYILPEILNV